MAQLALKLFYQKRSNNLSLCLHKNSNLSSQQKRKIFTNISLPCQTSQMNQKKQGRQNVMDKDFMTTVCFSIMGILRYLNIIEIITNNPVLQRAELINKMTTTEQRHKAANEKPLELHIAMQALYKKKKKKKKKGTYFNYNKKSHFAKECQLKLRNHPRSG